MLTTELLKIGERESGRAMNQHREIQIEHFPNMVIARSSGSAIVLTYSLCIATPLPDKPGDGIFHIGITGRKNDVLLNFLQSVFVNSKCLSLAMYRYNFEVQALTIDIKLVEADGNLYALCVSGINAIISKLDLKAFFTPVVFSYCAIGDRVVSDPDEREQQVSVWKGHVVMKSVREILLSEVNGNPCSCEAVVGVIDKAYEDMAALSK